MLRIDALNIEFHDHDMPETVVHDFNLTMAPGEIIGIVGESGSGKSMTALAVAGLLRRHDMVKTGHIYFEGVDVINCGRQELRKLQGRDIGIVFQEPMTSLNPVRRIGWQVEESLRIHTDLSRQELRSRALQALGEVELSDPERVYRSFPHELSGGMRQRVMIAAAVISEPKLLIADEPTTALDVTVQAQIVKLLEKINREKHMGILFISHDLSLVKKLCGQIVVMQGGYIVETGTAEDIFRNPREDYTKKLIAAIPKMKG